jgi:leader peptidase (prepilin peptidase)/N-methyltransferase
VIWLLILAGVLTGTLLNYLADSLPTARRLHTPKCAACGQPRPGVAWSGLAAYVTGHHRCPSCSTVLPVRHILVELVTPGLFVLCWARTGMTTTTLLHTLYSAVLVLIAVTDLEHRLILHIVTLPAIGLALIGAYTTPIFDSPRRALLGGAIGLTLALTLYLFGILFSWLLGRARGIALSGPAFGFGDVTLSTFLGLILGAPEIIFAIVIGILAGFVAAMLYLLVRGLIRGDHQAFTAFMPYGPFLIVGGMVMLYFGREFMAWYLNI